MLKSAASAITHNRCECDGRMAMNDLTSSEEPLTRNGPSLYQQRFRRFERNGP
jgi:hypothetical protein